MTSSHMPSNKEVLAKIEQIFENIADRLREQEDLAIPLIFKKRPSTSSGQFDDHVVPSIENIMFPGRSPREARRFGKLSMFILQI